MTKKEAPERGLSTKGDAIMYDISHKVQAANIHADGYRSHDIETIRKDYGYTENEETELQYILEALRAIEGETELKKKALGLTEEQAEAIAKAIVKLLMEL